VRTGGSRDARCRGCHLGGCPVLRLTVKLAGWKSAIGADPLAGDSSSGSAHPKVLHGTGDGAPESGSPPMTWLSVIVCTVASTLTWKQTRGELSVEIAGS
jgi:hypothetical protein